MFKFPEPPKQHNQIKPNPELKKTKIPMKKKNSLLKFNFQHRPIKQKSQFPKPDPCKSRKGPNFETIPETSRERESRVKREKSKNEKREEVSEMGKRERMKS